MSDAPSESSTPAVAVKEWPVLAFTNIVWWMMPGALLSTVSSIIPESSLPKLSLAVMLREYMPKPRAVAFVISPVAALIAKLAVSLIP
ncbi:Uncharacterised protein [uncultured archaeon]|nr:Uncharacterised protein [uncultured archaeon]